MKDLESYLETHFEIVKAITSISESDEPHGIVESITDEFGQGGLYELAKKLTDEFQELHEDTVWGEELDWHDTLDDFISEKLYSKDSLMIATLVNKLKDEEETN